jgi:DME family drug/metabolite transporter
LALAPFVSFGPVSPRAALAMAGLSVVCTFGGYLAYAHGLRRLSPSRAATIATLEPVVAMATAYAVWGESLPPVALLGAVAVVAGIVASARRAPAEAD